MGTIASFMTAEDLLKLPPDHMRHELVRGELTTMPPTSDEHGVRTLRLSIRIGVYVENHDLGVAFGAETGFLIARNPDTVRALDCAFVSKERMAKQGLTGKFYPAAPDLAVEVLSPSDSAGEVLEKIDEWLEAGTRLVWVVDPARKTVAVHAPNRPTAKRRLTDTLEGEYVLPGFTLAVAEIFR